jgi:metal-responsive CopG/Arc/MetJ family transcriptional regulator
MIMLTELDIDTSLIHEALKLGHFKNQSEVINTALREFINKRKQSEIIELFGKFDPDIDYDYKQGRKV